MKEELQGTYCCYLCLQSERKITLVILYNVTIYISHLHLTLSMLKYSKESRIAYQQLNNLLTIIH